MTDHAQRVDAKLNQAPDTKTCLIPISKWNEYHPWPPQGGIRHLRFHSKTNGFESAFKKVGSRVLVDEAAFFASVERMNADTASAPKVTR